MQRLTIGIGAGVGGLVGLAVIALKHFKIWPFKRVGRVATEDEGNNDEEENIDNDRISPGSSKSSLRRRHARSWKMERL